MRHFLPFVFFVFIMISHAEYGKAQKSSTFTNNGNEVIVSDSLQQQMRFGIDAERLWWWYSDISDDLAELGVKDIQSDYVRVAVNCAYELTEGEKNPDAYNKILNMMNAMKRANPEIKFFASPRPLKEAYDNPEDWPWTPYPMWIQEWTNNGTEEDPQWDKGAFHVDKLIKYFADYLNFMDQKGFEITWLDLTNEQKIIQPWHTKTIHDSLPEYLNDGVSMPKIIVPSSWSHQVGIDWLLSVDTTKDEHLAFSVASVHNTGGAVRSEKFVSEAQKLGDQEIWNTELHDWGGTNPQEAVLTSEVLWNHIRAGFNGIDTWLFYGNYAGRFHSMIYSNPNTGIRKSTQYEIFKKLVNNTNRGYYLSSGSFSSQVYITSFVKGNYLSVWVLNTSATAFDSVGFNLGGFNIESNVVEETRWDKNAPLEGFMHTLAPGETTFTGHIGPQSLYSFKMKLENPVGGGSDNQPRQSLDSIDMRKTFTIAPDGYSEGVYTATMPELTDSLVTGAGEGDFTYTQTPEPGAVISGEDIEVVLAISDAQGDTTRLFSSAHVGEDTQAPLIACKADTAVYVEPGNDYQVRGDELAPAYLSDNTAIDSLTNNINDSSSLAGVSIPEGTTEIIWEATDVAGYQSKCSFQITVEEKQEEETSIPSLKQNGISLYPNPSAGKFYYDCPDESVQQLHVLSSAGHVLIKRNIFNPTGMVDLSNYGHGVYILRILTDTQNYTTKVVNR